MEGGAECDKVKLSGGTEFTEAMVHERKMA